MSEIITHAEAKRQGLKSYFTGIPCARGHLAERRVGSRHCRLCERENTRTWAKDNKEKKQDWWKKNAHKRMEYYYARRTSEPEKYREIDRRNSRLNYWKHREKRIAKSAERRRKEAAAYRALRDLGIQIN